MGLKNEEKLDFTLKKIKQNFSNYSAWHQRIKLIEKENKSKDFAKELEMVKNAFFTEPNDQAPWIYYKWILDLMDDTLLLKSCWIINSDVKEIMLHFDRPVKFLGKQFNINNSVPSFKLLVLSSRFINSEYSETHFLIVPDELIPTSLEFSEESFISHKGVYSPPFSISFSQNSLIGTITNNGNSLYSKIIKQELEILDMLMLEESSLKCFSFFF